MFDYSDELTGDTAIFKLRGIMDLEGTAALRKTFWERFTNGSVSTLILDLSGVPLLEPSAVSLLVATKNVVAKWKGRLILTGLRKENMQLLEQTNLVNYFDIRASNEEALRSGCPESTG